MGTAASTADIRKDVECINEWMNGNGKIGAKTVLAGHTAAIDDHDKRIDALEKWKEDTTKFITELHVYVGIMVFVSSALGVSVIGLIWSLITGAVKLVH